MSPTILSGDPHKAAILSEIVRGEQDKDRTSGCWGCQWVTHAAVSDSIKLTGYEHTFLYIPYCEVTW